MLDGNVIKSKATMSRLLSPDASHIATDSGICSLYNEDDQIADNDVLNIIQASQKPCEYLDKPQRESTTLSKDASVQCNRSVIIKPKQIKNTPKNSLRCSHPPVLHLTHRNTVIYGDSSPSECYTTASFYELSPQSKESSTTKDSLSGNKPNSYNNDIFMQMRRNTENYKNIQFKVANDLPMHQSAKQLNWKSVLRLIDKHPNAQIEQPFVFTHSNNNNNKKKPFSGNILTTEIQKCTKPHERKLLNPTLRINGNPVSEDGFESDERFGFNQAYYRRQFRALLMNPTPGEIALMEGKEANTPKQCRRKKDGAKVCKSADVLSHSFSHGFPKIPPKVSRASNRSLVSSPEDLIAQANPNKKKQNSSHINKSFRKQNFSSSRQSSHKRAAENRKNQNQNVDVQIESFQLPPLFGKSRQDSHKDSQEGGDCSIKAPHPSMVSIPHLHKHSSESQEDFDNPDSNQVHPYSSSSSYTHHYESNFGQVPPPATPASSLPSGSLVTSHVNMDKYEQSDPESDAETDDSVSLNELNI